MDLPDNYFRDRSPADIIAKVATITLANISLLGSDELLRIGWLGNPLVDKLYKLGSTGLWVATELNAGGTLPTDALANTHMTSLSGQVTIADNPDYSDNTALNVGLVRKLRKRVAIVGGTLVNGVLANIPIVPAVAGYYGVIDSIRFLMATAPHDGHIKLTFQDEDDTALLGSCGGAIDLTVVAGVLNTALENIKLTQATYTDGKALEVDFATGADGGGDAADDYPLVIQVEYHYET